MAVHATITSIDRASIMHAAWSGYRAQIAAATRHKAHIGDTTPLQFSRELFARYLRSEWAREKSRVALEAQIASKATPAVVAIRSELRAMELSDAPINWDRHRALSIELFRASASM